MKIELIDRQLEFREITDLIADDRVIDDLDPATAKALYSANLIGGALPDDSTAKLEFRSNFEIEAVNRSNPAIVEVPDDDDDDRLLERPRHPWSYDGSDTALIYRITGRVNGGIETGELPVGPGGGARLGLQAASAVTVSHVRLHKRQSKVGPAVASDLGDGGGFRFALDPRHLTRLEPGREFLMAEFQAGFRFSADFSWGQVFRAKPAFVRSFFSGGSMIGAASGRPVEAGLVAEARVRTSYAARLQLIASMVDESTARIDFRRASTGTLGISAGARVTADSISRADARAALSGLLSRAVGNLGLDPASFDRRLGELADVISSARDRFDLSDLYDAANEPVKLLAREWTDGLSLGLPQLLGFKEKYDELWEGLDLFRSRLAFPGDRFRKLAAKIDEKLATIALPALTEPYRALAATILGSPRFGGNNLVSLAGFLAVPDYEKVVAELLGDSADRIPELRREVLLLVEGLDLEQLLEQDEWNLLRLVGERTGMPVAEIAAGISLRELLESFIEPGTGLSVEGILRKLSVFNPENIPVPGSLGELAAALESWFGIPVSRLPDKINTLLDQLSGALPLVAEASAIFEFSLKKEHESLFAFEFTGLDDPATAAVLTRIYGDLLGGDLDGALSAYRDSALRQRFRVFEFFAAESVERRASFRLRFLSTLQKQEGTSTRRRIANIDGAIDHRFSECAAYDNKTGTLTKTRASGSTLLTASSGGFVAVGRENAKDFSYRLETSLAWSGQVELSGITKRKRKRNRRMLEFFGQLLDESGKLILPSGNVVSLLNELFAQAGEEDFVELKFQLVLEPVMVGHFWSSAPPLDWNETSADRGAFMKNYEWAWRKLEAVRPDGTGDEANEAANFNQYFNALARLAESARSEGVAHLDGRMRTWRRRHNRTGSDMWKIDKYCYAAALVRTLPANRPGWSLTASLALGDRQIFLA